MNNYYAYEVSESVCSVLQSIFPPKFPDFIGHHITFQLGTDIPDGLGEMADIEVIGYVQDESLEMFVVLVNGENLRPNGQQYHITWSLDRSKGRKPMHSNDVIGLCCMVPIDSIHFQSEMKLFER